MATKKDLVEAYSFSRRRLVTAFVSGAPGGREVEPARPGRTIVGGLALAVLLIAGAAIAGIFSPSVPDDWTEPGLVVSEEEGEAYVITEPEQGADADAGPVLRPVLNITSAKLILGSDASPRIVPQAEIDGEEIGEDIGILGAPATIPSDDRLIDSGWTACTSPVDGVRVTIVEDPAVDPDANGAFLVSSEGSYYVIAVSGQESDPVDRGYRYLLPGDPGERDSILSGLELGTSVDNAVEVSQDWLTLFPPGAALDRASFGVEDEGARPSDFGADTGIPKNARVGDILSSGSEKTLLTVDGPAPLSDFAYAVYSHLTEPKTPRERDATGLLSEGRARSPYLDNHWPVAIPETTPGVPCAVLQTSAGKPPAAVPGQLSTDEVTVTASPADVPLEQKSQGVQAGRGAYVLVGDWTATTLGEPFLIDSKGKAYPLIGFGAADQLGYENHDAPVVPDSWIHLFDEGVPLSEAAALCPPNPKPGVTC